MGKLGPNEFLLRLAKDSGAHLRRNSAGSGLTSREGEVLSWLSKGKTNRDIAQIRAEPADGRQASRQIYSKLGVEIRTAAAAASPSTRRIGNRELRR